jgi:SnoaL-like domain
MNLQHTIDHLAILNRYAAYTYAVDSGNVKDFQECFTPDATMDISSFKIAWKSAAEAFRKFADASGIVRGAENLGKSVGFVRFHHVTANVLIRSIDGNRAKGAAYFVVFSPDEGKIEHYGRYEDELVRCSDGIWRFSSRLDIALYERDHALPFKTA